MWIWSACIGIAFLLVVASLVRGPSIAPALRERSPSWSPDGTRIVFAAARGDAADLYVMNADGTRRVQMTSTPWREGAPAFSPDGARIAFESDRDGNFDIYVMPESIGEPRKLTDDHANDRTPVWAPNGRTIAFVSDRAGANNSSVFIMNADGTEVRRIVTGPAEAPQFSPDGRSLAVVIDGAVHLVDLGTRAVRQVGRPSHARTPTWSPRGDRLAFASTEHGETRILTMDLDGSNLEVLVAIPRQAVIEPRWSPDGTNVAFVSVDVPDIAGDSPAIAEAILTLDLSSSRLARLSR